MVSFHTPLSPNQTRKTTTLELENLSKKRKQEELEGEEIFEKRSKPENPKSVDFDIELHLETPLPLEWQRCLDIQSGQVHFYNTRTHKRTSKDPRRSPEPTPAPAPPSPADHMSLDLELNLPCGSLRQLSNRADIIKSFTKHNTNSNTSKFNSSDQYPSTLNSSLLKKSPSWLAFEGEEDNGEEMVATVCKQCFMLVMLCKSSPACPNCKFMHPPDQSPPNLFKRRCSLLY